MPKCDFNKVAKQHRFKHKAAMNIVTPAIVTLQTSLDFSSDFLLIQANESNTS